MRRRLLGNTGALIVVQVVNYIAPFIILVHLTKTLGLEIYGVLAFAQGIIGLSAVLLDFGYSLSATNKISKNRNAKRYIGKVIGGISLVKIFLFLLCAVLITIFSLLTKKYADYKIVFLLSLFPIAMQGLLPIWFFHGIEKMHFFAFASIASKVIFAFAAIAFIKSPADYFLVPLLIGLGQFLAVLISIYFIYKIGYRINLPNFKFVAYCFKFTRKFFASRVAVASYMNGAIIVLGLMAQPTVVAVYSMAEQLYKVMQSALGPVASAAYPYMTKEKDTGLMFRLISGLVVTALIAACIGYFSAPTLVELVFDQTWLASIPVLNIFLVAIVVHAATVMTGYPLAALVNKLEVANASVITGSVVYFLTLGLIIHLNAVTPVYLALVMLISELSVFLHRSTVLIPLAIKRTQTINQ